MKQTAVNWLIDQMLKQGYFEKDKPLTYTNLGHLQHQAEEMEKQQIMDAIEYHIDLLNQTEISDEEIDKEANKFSNHGACITSFFYGAKWYKEQLKK